RKGVFFMKYDWKFKLDCVLKYKEGIRNFVPAGVVRRGFLCHVRSWVKAYDDLGIDGLKHSSFNKEWTAEQRFGLVAKVLAGDSVANVAKNAHINGGQLYQWVRKYREKGMDGLQLRKGRKPTETNMPKKKAKLTQTEQEELKLLRERNRYLEAENLYLKKLRALELEKTAKLAKAKRRESSKPSKKNPDAA
ncbi:MAG: helix-turn-helix domain-containing protein, partial [Fibrobacter sp.]|nr:helix-turn-helix domain-containing protein [Fibrobacter sp.]